MKVSSAILLLVFASNHKTATATKPSLRASATVTEELLGHCLTGCHSGQYANTESWWDHRCTCDTGWSGDCCDDYVGQCTQGMSELCDSSKLVLRSFKTSELLDENGDYQGPITLGTGADHNLPINMQGVFWLQDQAGSSSLISMATSRDGRGLSVWNENSDLHISVRVPGDRVWSMGSKGLYWPIEMADLVYHFHGSPQENPTHFNIIPEMRGINPGEQVASFLMSSFEMNLILPGTTEHYYPAAGDRPAAVMWDRPSKILGFDLESARYQVAQVINGEGKPTSAYDAFIAYNQGDEEWQDGTIWYHEVSNDASSTEDEVHAQRPSYDEVDAMA